MDEYISREETLKAFRLTAKNPNKDYQRGMQDTIDCLVPEVIADIPSADVQPVRYGRWIIKGQEIYCSECDTESSYNSFGASQFTRFCPNCGARMDGDAE